MADPVRDLTHFERVFGPLPVELWDRAVESFAMHGLEPTSLADMNAWVATPDGQTAPFIRAAASVPDEEERATAVFLYMARVALRAYGDRVYALTHRLTERLLLTNLRDVPADLVRCPLPAFYLRTPPFATVFHPETGEHPVNGCYVFEDAKDGLINAVWTGDPNENSPSEFDDALFHFSLRRSEIHGDVESIVERSVAARARPEWGRGNMERAATLVRLLLNALLYISSESADVIRLFNPEWAALNDRRNVALRQGKREKARALWERMRSVPQRERLVLGSRIQRDLLPPGVALDSPSNRHLISRHIVAGHWRRVWTGPRAAPVAVPHWIQPYFRGEEMAERVHRGPTRAVDEPD